MGKELNILSVIDRYKIILILTTICSLLLMTFYLFFLAKPVYQAKTQVLIYQSNTQENKVDSQDVQANLNLVGTYSKIILSPRILNQVRDNLGNKYTLEELINIIKVSNDTSSQIIEISAEYSNYQAAANISDETAHVFKAEISELMKIDNVNLLSEAESIGNSKPIRPQKLLMLFFSALLGLLTGIMIIMIKVLTDRTVKTSEDISQILDINLLGQINSINDKDFSQ